MKNNKDLGAEVQLGLIAKKNVLSFREALLYMDLSESMLYKMTSKNEIRFSKPNNGKIYFRKTDLDEWMLKNSTNSISELEHITYNHLKANENENR